jgi:outer membrane protein assembly complex protein YaeT
MALVDLSLGGTFDAPRPRGTVEIRDGTARSRDIPQAATEIGAIVRLEGERVAIEQASVVLGGGHVDVAGEAKLTASGLDSVRVTVKGIDLALRYPEGLKTRLDADLKLTGKTGGLVLAGDVKVERGLYDLDTALDQSLTAVPPPPVESPLLRSIGLDVRVTIENPVIVNNNLAHLEVTGDLAIRGDLETPAPFGRVEIESGSLYLQGRDFRVSSGRLTYGGDWNPIVALSAETRIQDAAATSGQASRYLVTLRADGPLLTVKPSLGGQAVSASDEPLSEPPLSQAEVVSLIATGTRSQSANVGRFMGEQAAAMLAGRVSSGVLKGLGLSSPPNQPELLSRELEPGARFTFGKQLLRQVWLIYSLGLNGPEQRFLQLEVEPLPSIDLKGQRTDDGTLTYALGQRLRFGGAPRARRAADSVPRLSDIQLTGDRPLPEDAMRGELRAKPGKRVSSWDLQDDAERLRERLVREGHLEAEVTARREGDIAVFRVRAGPRYTWRVTGMEQPPDLSSDIRKALFEEEALERGRDRLLAALRSRGYLRAEVDAQVQADAQGRTLVFGARPGPHLVVTSVHFPGASRISAKELLHAAGGEAALLTSPTEARSKIEALYRARHRLAARVAAPLVEEHSGRIAIRVPIDEGPLARIASLRFDGASLPEASLKLWASLAQGTAFTKADAAAAVERLRDGYLSRGYPAVRVAASLVPRGSDLDVVFEIAEGERVVVGGFEISGLVHTRESLVRRQLHLAAGEPLDIRKLAEIERRLLGLGLFARVSVTSSADNPATILVRLEEDANMVASYELRYSSPSSAGAGTDTEASTLSGAKLTLDAERRNILGVGLAVGGRYLVGTADREARSSIHIPLGRGSLTGSVFHLEHDADVHDIITGELITDTTVQRGFALQQAIPIGIRWNLLYGYRFKRSSSTQFPDPLTVAGVDASMTHDTRDSPLDPRRGHFVSATLSYSPEFLGADFTFIKGYAQASFATPLTGSTSWAQSYRIGLAHGFGGQMLVSSERFTAGGANSLRGFENGSVGPRDFLGDPTGGEATVVINEELRYRHTSGIGAAVFYDVGNVFETVSAMSFDLRHTLGLGLRYDSPIGLLRLDIGFPLARQEGEKAYQLFFSLGQAF